MQNNNSENKFIGLLIKSIPIIASTVAIIIGVYIGVNRPIVELQKQNAAHGCPSRAATIITRRLPGAREGLRSQSRVPFPVVGAGKKRHALHLSLVPLRSRFKGCVPIGCGFG